MKITDCRPDGHPVMMIQMSIDEALKTVEGMMHQIIHRTTNSGRYERFCDCGTSFSIAVVPDIREKSSTEKIMEKAIKGFENQAEPWKWTTEEEES